MTYEEISRLATRAGWAHLDAHPEEKPPPGHAWTSEALHAALAERQRLARAYGVNIYQLPKTEK